MFWGDPVGSPLGCRMKAISGASDLTSIFIGPPTSLNKIYDFVRAQTKPYPGAFSNYGNDKVTIWSCRIDYEATEQSLAPSEIKEVSQQIFVGCGQGSALEILDIAVNDMDLLPYDWWLKNIDTKNNSKFHM